MKLALELSLRKAIGSLVTLAVRVARVASDVGVRRGTSKSAKRSDGGWGERATANAMHLASCMVLVGQPVEICSR